MRVTIQFALLAISVTQGLGQAAAAEPEAANPARGAALFLQCRACHAVTRDGIAGVGPNLWGVVGARAGVRSGFHYSASLTDTGIVWDPKTLDRWLTQPTAVAPGTTMAFQGVASPRARADIIAYLSQLGPARAVKSAAPGSR